MTSRTEIASRSDAADSRPQPLYSVQILRAIAACTVAYLHTFTPPLFGLFGVDLFFVISGFVMCMVVDTKRPTPGAFIIDRVTRVVPLYWAATTAVLLLGWIRPQLLGSTVASLGAYLKSLFFIPYLREDGQMFPLLMPGWSLNYEMSFYAVFACMLALHRGRYKLHVAGAMVVLYGLSAVSSSGLQRAAHEFLHQTLWLEFVLGIICHSIYRHRLVQRTPKAVALSLVVIGYALMIAFENDADRLLTAGMPAFLMLLFGLQLDEPLRRLHGRALRFIVHVGDASYATYLSHMFVIGLVERVVFPRLGIEKSVPSALLTLACCLFAGSLLYRAADKPLTALARRLGYRMIEGWKPVRWGRPFRRRT